MYELRGFGPSAYELAIPLGGMCEWISTLATDLGRLFGIEPFHILSYVVEEISGDGGI